MNPLPNSALVLALLSSVSLTACDKSSAQPQPSHHQESRKIVGTSPIAEDVIVTRRYVSQIRSRRHIEVRALDNGYLQQVLVQEGQHVKAGTTMFKIVPVLYQAKLDSENAEAQVAEIKYNNTQVLSDKAVVSPQELALAKAELARARAKVGLARAEFNFTDLRAPFDGIVDRQYEQQGSLVAEGDVLSTLSDNEVMWVYFNVPEAGYLEYKSGVEKEELDIQLQLANGDFFKYPGKIGAIEAEFNNETGNIAFRADFPNPERLLRHGQTGTILMRRKVKGAIVIPQRATFEILANRYVFVLEPDTGKTTSDAHAAPAEHDEKSAKKPNTQHGIVRQRQIVVSEEQDDIYLIKSGLSVTDRIIFEGVRQVRDGDKVEYDLESAESILKDQKFHAE